MQIRVPHSVSDALAFIVLVAAVALIIGVITGIIVPVEPQ